MVTKSSCCSRLLVVKYVVEDDIRHNEHLQWWIGVMNTRWWIPTAKIKRTKGNQPKFWWTPMSHWMNVPKVGFLNFFARSKGALSSYVSNCQNLPQIWGDRVIQRRRIRSRVDWAIKESYLNDYRSVVGFGGSTLINPMQHMVSLFPEVRYEALCTFEVDLIWNLRIT